MVKIVHQSVDDDLKEYVKIKPDIAHLESQLTQKVSQPMGLVHRNEALFDTDFVRDSLISFVSDDGCIEDLTVFKPLFDEFNWKFTMAIQTAYVGTTDKYGKPIMTWEQIRSMYHQGFTVASHTVTHEKLAEITIEEAERQLKDSREILLNKGFDVRHIMYPNGSFNTDVLNIAKKYYLSGGTIVRAENTTTTAKAAVNRISVLNQTITQLKGYVDSCLANKSWVVFYIHGFEVTDYPDFLPKLQELMQYIQTQGIKVLPYDDGYDLFIRKSPMTALAEKPNNKFIVTEDVSIPSATASHDYTFSNFGYSSAKFTDIITADTTNGRFDIKDTGLYMISYCALTELEANASVTASLSIQAVKLDGSTVTAKERQQDFVVSTGLMEGANLKSLPLNGTVTMFIDPTLYKGFYVIIKLLFRNQSTTKTNKIKTYGDTTHVDIVKLS